MTISQRRVQTQRPQAHIGELVTSSRHQRCTTLINKAPQAVQIDDVIIDTAADDTLYGYDVDGFTIRASSAVGATKQSIAEALIAAHNANMLVRGRVKASLQGIDRVRLIATHPDVPFALVEDDARLSTASIQSQADAEAIPFGRVLISMGYMDEPGMSSSGFNELCALPKSTRLARRTVVLTPTPENNAVFHLSLECEGKHYDCSYAADADATAKEIVEGWAAKVSEAMPANTIDVVEDDATLTLTAAVPGKHFEFTVWAEGTGAAAIAVTSDSDPLEADIHRVIAGISVRRYDEAAREVGSSLAEYMPEEGVEALEDGVIWMASTEAPTRSEQVWLETDPGQDVGAVFTTSSPTRLRLTCASWQRSARQGLDAAALRFARP